VPTIARRALSSFKLIVSCALRRQPQLLGEWAGRRVDSALPPAAGRASGDVWSSPRGE
jgi:hypothetical protein